MVDEIMRQEERILLKEPLNKSSAAEQRIFFPIHAEWKTGNTRSIPLFSILLSEKKSLAASSCLFIQSFLNATPQSIESMAAVRLAKNLVPLAAKTDVVAEAFSWARFINQTGISRMLLNHPLTKLGERLCSEHRALDFHQAVFDSTHRDKLLAQI